MVCWQGSCVTKASIRLSDCNPAHCSSIGGQCSSVFPRFPLLSNSPAETTAPIIQNNNPNISNSIYPTQFHYYDYSYYAQYYQSFDFVAPGNVSIYL